MRLLAIWLVPLEPPARLVPLIDPFVRVFEGGRDVTKDLFFSGHVATAVLMLLLARGARVRLAFLASTVLLSALILLQHVHYAVDVAAAPAFAWLAFKAGERLAGAACA